MKHKLIIALAFLPILALQGQEQKALVLKNVSQGNPESPTVTFINEDQNLNPAIQEGFKKIIFDVYPRLVKDFNPEARQDLTVKIDTAYKGVAYAHDGQITVSSRWLSRKPEDLDLMTHEIMHIVQSYPSNAGPGWLTEGIADYVRYQYGLDNKGAGWSLPDYRSGQSYKDSYRVTARFLVWLTENFDEDIVFKLDRSLRNKVYSASLWNELTGKELDELWDSYSKNSEIKLK